MRTKLKRYDGDYEELRRTVEFVPAEILEAAKQMRRINHPQTVETIAKGE